MTGILVPEGTGEIAVPWGGQEEVLVRPANRYLPHEVLVRETRGVPLSATGVPLREEIIWKDGYPFFIPGIAARSRESRARNRISNARIDESLAMGVEMAEEDRRQFMERRSRAMQKATFDFMARNWEIVRDEVAQRMKQYHKLRGEEYF